MWKRLDSYLIGFGGLAILLFILSMLWKTLKHRPQETVESLLQEFRQMTPLVIAQAKHETGNFTSNIFKNANNMFGMKVPIRRKSWKNGVFTARDGQQYSSYANTDDSIRDLVEWFRFTNMPICRNADEYAQALKNRGYYTDTVQNYSNGLKRYL